jgi:hypothetical protein
MQSLLRWPEPESVLNQVHFWGSRWRPSIPAWSGWACLATADGVTLGVGSDLDLLLIDIGSSGPQHQRLLAWSLAGLLLSCDALVLTPSEHAELLASGSKTGRRLAARQPLAVAALSRGALDRWSQRSRGLAGSGWTRMGPASVHGFRLGWVGQVVAMCVHGLLKRLLASGDDSHDRWVGCAPVTSRLGPDRPGPGAGAAVLRDWRGGLA